MDVSEFKSFLWEYTRKINESANLAFQPIFEQYGLTGLQVRVLVEIYKNKTHTIGSLADRVQIAGANISTICKKLEQKQLLERMRDSKDERVVKVILTKKGKMVVEEIDRILCKRIAGYLQSESKETLDEIIVGLKKLNKLLCEIGKIDSSR